MRTGVRLIACTVFWGCAAAGVLPRGCVAVGALSSWCAAANAGALERRVIHPDEIREAGVTRLSDLVFLFDDWAPSTVDGFSWEMAPRGGAADLSASWVVLVDSVRIDTDRFGYSSLNLVPVHVSEIDSIEVTRLPVMSHGEFAQNGLIHFHTRRPAGYGIGGTASTGNESGDPGPYAYTGYATPNVDRIGPDYAAYGEYGGDDAWVRAVFHRHRHYPTDESVLVRNFGIAAGEYPQMTLITGSGSFGGNLLGGSHRAFAAGTRFDDYFFFKPYGREIPVRSRLTTGGISGRVPLGERAGIEYRAAYTQQEIEHRPNSFDLDFDWREERWRGSAEVSLDGSALRQRYGAGFESVRSKTGYALSKCGYDLADIYAGWDLFAIEDHSQRAGVRLTAGEERTALEAFAAERWRASPSHRFDLTASYAETLPERDGRIWYWDERGYRFLEDSGVDVSRDKTIGTARRWSVDAAWSADFGSRFAGAAAAWYRASSNLVLEEQRFQFDSFEQAFGAPVRLVADQEGGVAGGELSFEARAAGVLKLCGVYRFEKPVTGDEMFRLRCDAVPRHLFRQTASYAVAPNFKLWARLNYTSAAEWHDYDDAEAQSDGLYRAKVDPFVTIDAAAVKWLWERRLKGSILFRDLLRQAPRYHPIGAAFDTSVFVEIEVGIGSQER